MTSDHADRILQILNTEKACQFEELNNRAKKLGIPNPTVDQVCRELVKDGKAVEKYVQTPSENKTETKFIYSTNFPTAQIERMIQEKADLLGKHYDLHYEIGLHGEKVVANVCEELGYTEIETRKEKYVGQDLLEVGILRRDIDVFAKHPTQEYYQDIEVKNRRARVEEAEIENIIKTTNLANSRWPIHIEPALVALRATKTAEELLEHMRIPIAYAGQIHVPEKYRDLYEKLNQRLAYDFCISDIASQYLRDNIANYIRDYSYETIQSSSPENVDSKAPLPYQTIQHQKN